MVVPCSSCMQSNQQVPLEPKSPICTQKLVVPAGTVKVRLMRCQSFVP